MSAQTQERPPSRHEILSEKIDAVTAGDLEKLPDRQRALSDQLNKLAQLLTNLPAERCDAIRAVMIEEMRSLAFAFRLIAAAEITRDQRHAATARWDIEAFGEEMTRTFHLAFD